MSDFITSIVGAFLGFGLALQKFRSEKWWELKVSAYQRIIEALHQLTLIHEYFVDKEMGKIRILSGEEEGDLKEKSKFAEQEISKSIALETFLISERAQLRLRKYEEKIHSLSSSLIICGDGYQYHLQCFSAQIDCIKDINSLAKEDLDGIALTWLKKVKTFTTNLLQIKIKTC